MSRAFLPMPNHYMRSARILQVLFPKKFKNIPTFSKKKADRMAVRSDLWMKTRTGSGNPAVLWPDIHQNDVGTDLADTVPGNAVMIPPSADSQIPAWSRHDDGADFPLRHFHFHILDETQPAPVGDTDHFLALKLGEFYCHSLPLLYRFGAVYAGAGEDRTCKFQFVGGEAPAGNASLAGRQLSLHHWAHPIRYCPMQNAE